MDIATLRAFFMWCTIINAALMVVSFLMLVLAGGWVYRIHSRMFSISREAFNVAIYSFLGLYKVLIFVFNVVPWIAFEIVG